MEVVKIVNELTGLPGYFAEMLPSGNIVAPEGGDVSPSDSRGSYFYVREISASFENVKSRGSCSKTVEKKTRIKIFFIFDCVDLDSVVLLLLQSPGFYGPATVRKGWEALQGEGIFSGDFGKVYLSIELSYNEKYECGTVQIDKIKTLCK